MKNILIRINRKYNHHHQNKEDGNNLKSSEIIKKPLSKESGFFITRYM